MTIFYPISCYNEVCYKGTALYKRLMGYHSSLQDILEDQLSLAPIHYLRSHYQEAIDIYKRILLDNRSV